MLYCVHSTQNGIITSKVFRNIQIYHIIITTHHIVSKGRVHVVVGWRTVVVQLVGRRTIDCHGSNDGMANTTGVVWDVLGVPMLLKVSFSLSFTVTRTSR